MQGEWSRCRFAVTSTQGCPLCVGLDRRDSLAEDRRQQFVIRSVGGGEMQLSNRAKCCADRRVMTVHLWGCRCACAETAVSGGEPLATLAPSAHFVFAILMNVDGDRARTVGRESGPFDVGVLTSDDRTECHTGGGVEVAVAQQCEVVGVKRNTYEGT